MIVVGSGAIGVEFAHFYNAMGTDVTIVEYMPNIVPVEDIDISKQFERSIKKAGIKVMTNSSVEAVDTSGEGVVATVKTKKGAKKPYKRMFYFRLLELNRTSKILVWRMSVLL